MAERAMTDEELIDYCASHCRTERAVFHRGQVTRVMELAGRWSSTKLPEWVAVREDVMMPLVESARTRLADKAREQHLYGDGERPHPSPDPTS
jgi:hypothetical protein